MCAVLVFRDVSIVFVDVVDSSLFDFFLFSVFEQHNRIFFSNTLEPLAMWWIVIGIVSVLVYLYRRFLGVPNTALPGPPKVGS